MKELSNINIEQLFEKSGISLKNDPELAKDRLQMALRTCNSKISVLKIRREGILNGTLKPNETKKELERIEQKLIELHEIQRNLEGFIVIFQNPEYLKEYKTKLKESGIIISPEEFLNLKIKKEDKSKDLKLEEIPKIEKKNYLEKMQQKFNSVQYVPKSDLDRIKDINFELRIGKEETFINDLTREEYKIYQLGFLQYTVDINMRDLGLTLYKIEKTKMSKQTMESLIISQLDFEKMKTDSNFKQMVLNFLLNDMNINYSKINNGSYVGEIYRNMNGQYSKYVDQPRRLASIKAKREKILDNVEKTYIKKESTDRDDR